MKWKNKIKTSKIVCQLSEKTEEVFYQIFEILKKYISLKTNSIMKLKFQIKKKTSSVISDN